MFWLIVSIVVVALAFVLWHDRRHHGRIDQSRVRDGITRNWTDEATMSRRDHYRD